MTGKWIRVFEHQTLRVGDPVEGGRFEERHWRKLSHFLEVSRYPYFQITPESVRFQQYVGAIQIDELTLEIVPKTDREHTGDTGTWQLALLDMLRVCRLWRGEWLAGARLQVKPGALLEWYCRYFLEETEKLLRRGLLKNYRRQQERRKDLRGRLLPHKQMVETQPVFWTERENFHYDHPYNRWLKAALKMIAARYPDEHLRERAAHLHRRFPDLSDERPPLPPQIREPAYRSPLLIAQLLLRHFTPALRRGEHPLMAVLFDMNLLFEEYVARQLEMHGPPGAHIRRQLSLPFWNRRSIRPDLVLDYAGKRFVIDTKWKIPPQGRPAMEDIRQIYVYNEYFGADQGILLYPGTAAFPEQPAVSFAPTPGRTKPHSCRILAAPVVNETGQLDATLGKLLWNRILEVDIG